MNFLIAHFKGIRIVLIMDCCFAAKWVEDATAWFKSGNRASFRLDIYAMADKDTQAVWGAARKVYE